MSVDSYYTVCMIIYGFAVSVSEPKRLFPDPTFQIIPGPALALDPFPNPGQNQTI